MKIRTDFVTNSSSSSFIVMYKDVDIDTISLKDRDLYFIGKELSEGIDFFKIESDEMLELVKIVKRMHDRWDSYSIIDIVDIQEDDCFTLSPGSIKETVRVRGLECDYHTSYSPDVFISRYIEVI